MCRDGEDPKIARQQKVVFQLTGRTHCDLQKATELCITSASATLSDVGANRCSGAAHLGSQYAQLIFGEVSGVDIHFQRQVMASLPHLQLSEVLHVLALMKLTADR